MIEACQAAIVEGEAYQLCLTTEATVHVSPDPVATYLALRALEPDPPRRAAARRRGRAC